jgi:hypothetical protein
MGNIIENAPTRNRAALIINRDEGSKVLINGEYQPHLTRYSWHNVGRYAKPDKRETNIIVTPRVEGWLVALPELHNALARYGLERWPKPHYTGRTERLPSALILGEVFTGDLERFALAYHQREERASIVIDGLMAWEFGYRDGLPGESASGFLFCGLIIEMTIDDDGERRFEFSTHT